MPEHGKYAEPGWGSQEGKLPVESLLPLIEGFYLALVTVFKREEVVGDPILQVFE